MNDEHDNAATDKEMSERFARGGVVKKAHQAPPDSQSIDVRLYFDKGEELEHLLDEIGEALQAHPGLACLISAYQLKNDGFSHLTPDDKPLA